MKLKKVGSFLLYALLFFGFLGFFIFLMFPYSVLKDSILAMASDASGLTISAEELSPAFLVGADLSGVTVQAPGVKNVLKIDEVSITMNPLYLLLGKLAVDFSIDKGKKQGELDASMKISLIDLMQNRVNISKMSISSDNFLLNDAFSFFLERLAKAPDGNPLVAGMLAKMVIEGSLEMDVDLKLDSSQIANSKGKVDIEIKKGIVKFTDPGLQIEDQVFNKAHIIAKVEAGKIVIEKESGISSTGVDSGFNGKLMLSNDLLNSSLDFIVNVKLKDKIKEQFGWIMDAATGKGGGAGEVNYQIRGTLGQPHPTII